MSYNNIGLPTPRGTGTSGYIQRNFAAVKPRRQHEQKKAAAAAFGSDALLHTRLTRPPNAALLEHQRKRQLELKCAELEERMEEQGYADDEIAEKVAEFRTQLAAQAAAAEPKAARWVRGRGDGGGAVGGRRRGCWGRSLAGVQCRA